MIYFDNKLNRRRGLHSLNALLVLNCDPFYVNEICYSFLALINHFFSLSLTLCLVKYSLTNTNNNNAYRHPPQFNSPNQQNKRNLSAPCTTKILLISLASYHSLFNNQQRKKVVDGIFFPSILSCVCMCVGACMCVCLCNEAFPFIFALQLVVHQI